LREDVGQEAQISQDYRGPLIYELLQNADDAMEGDDQSAKDMFAIDQRLALGGQFGRPLDEPDVRGFIGLVLVARDYTVRNGLQLP